jgi:spore coat-associated protein N
MNRFYALADRPKRTLGVLAVVLAAVGVTVGSGAAFTAQSANPSNTFTAGTLTMTNSLDGAAVLTASNMKPGDTATGTVDIRNTGSLSGAFTLTRTNLTNSDAGNPMSVRLNVLVEDCGDFSSGTPACDASDPDIYNGTLDAMNGTYALGNFASNVQHRYRFTVTFDSAAGNVYQGDNSSARFQWDATS